MLSIQDYSVKVEHCPGRENLVVDTLSRVQPGRDWGKEKGPWIVTLHSHTNKVVNKKDEEEKRSRKSKEQKGKKTQKKLHVSAANNEENEKK